MTGECCCSAAPRATKKGAPRKQHADERGHPLPPKARSWGLTGSGNCLPGRTPGRGAAPGAFLRSWIPRPGGAPGLERMETGSALERMDASAHRVFSENRAALDALLRPGGVSATWPSASPPAPSSISLPRPAARGVHPLFLSPGMRQFYHEGPERFRQPMGGSRAAPRKRAVP